MTQEDEIGPWSEDKLDLLRKYLHAYTAIMRGQTWCRNGYHYVDAFAGTGKPRARDEERYIDGSPRIALALEHPFSRYTFIEKEPWRVKQLLRLQTEYPSLDIRVRQGDCNGVLATEVVPKIRREFYNRGLVFLDPFGMEIDWTTIQAIAETQALEIFLNFPVMAINRTVLRKNPVTLTPDQVDRMNRFWGTEDWRDSVYEEVPSLFGPVEIKANRTSGARLGQLFKDRLQEVFPYVTDPLVMVNSKNAPLYCLMLASHNKTGAKIVNDIFGGYQRLGH